MRRTFHLELADLGSHSATMCRDACAALEQATQALLHADLATAERVITMDARFDEMQSTGEGLAYRLLALQAPVAGDLRTVVAALRIIADIRRMGALALHIATAARRQHPEHAVPASVRPTFERMGETGVRIGQRAAVAVEEQDVEIARNLEVEDQLMDALQERLFDALGDPAWSGGIGPAVNTALLSRFYERFADHAVEIGRRVEYLVTGEDPGTRRTSAAKE